MNFMNVFLSTGGSTSAQVGTTMILYVVIIVAMLYFMAIRPQKKQQKAMNELSAALAAGDSIITASGFYGVVIDINNDVVVVEFGNNKNCRIPMKKSAIVAVEKPDGTTFSLDK